MSSHVDTINRLNKEMAKALRDRLGSLGFLHEKFNARSFMNELYRQDQLCLKTEFGTIPANLFKGIEAAKDIADFWSVYRGEYLQSLIDCELSLVFTDLFNKPLASGFDTVCQPFVVEKVVIENRLQDIHSQVGQRQIVQLVAHLRGLWHLIPYLEIGSGTPLIAFCEPGALRGLVRRDPSDMDMDVITAAFEVIDQLLGHSGAGKDLLGFVSNPLKSELKNKMRDLSVLPFWSLIFEHAKDLHARSQLEAATYFRGEPMALHPDLIALARGESTEASEIAFQILLMDLFERVLAVDHQISICDLIGAEPLVQNVQIFQQVMETGSQRLINAAGLDHELALARVLSFPDFAWIAGMDVDELQEFRHKDGSTVFRDALWNSRKVLKRASLEEFDTVVQAVDKELNEAIAKHNAEVAKYKKSSKMDKTLVAVGLGGSLGLGLLSLAAPPIAGVTVPLALASLLIGSSSVRDLINLHIKQKKNIEELHQRPIGILALHHNKAGTR